MVLRLRRKGLAVGEVPGFPVEAVPAVVAAAAHKEGDADAGTVGNIIFLNDCVIHKLTS